jgi:predicted enzyme related to lactoylglutathione lyase
MLQDSHAFSGFSVNDQAAAKKFYSETLGLEVEEDAMGLTLKTTGNNGIFIYAKPDHQPASFTILNFPVDDIEAAVKELKGKGVQFEQYDFGGGAKTDEHDIMRGKAAQQGPDIAWFKDPAGNVLSVLES